MTPAAGVGYDAYIMRRFVVISSRSGTWSIRPATRYGGSALATLRSGSSAQHQFLPAGAPRRRPPS